MRSSESIAFTDYIVFCVAEHFVAYITMILIGRYVIIPFWAIIRDISKLTWTFYPVLGFNNARVLGASCELEVNYKSLEAWTLLYPRDGFNTCVKLWVACCDIWCDLQRCFIHQRLKCNINVIKWFALSLYKSALVCCPTGLFLMICIGSLVWFITRYI